MSRAPYTTPKQIETSGDDSPASSLWGYVRRMTGRSQYFAFALSILVTGLSLAPIELQRRMFDDAIGQGDLRLLLTLGGVFIAVLILQQFGKLWLGVLQGWMTESAMRYTRLHLWQLRGGDESLDGEGRNIVSVLTTETQALAGFAGAAPSQALSNIAMLVGTLAYMFYVEPWVALAGMLLLLPQTIVAPVMQNRLNRLVSIQVRLNRMFTASIDRDTRPDQDEIGRRLLRMFRNRMSFVWRKFIMKSLLNLMNAAAPVGVIVMGGWLVLEDQTTIGVIVAFVSGFGRLGDPIRQLINFYREAAQARVRHDMVASWMSSSEHKSAS